MFRSVELDRTPSATERETRNEKRETIFQRSNRMRTLQEILDEILDLAAMHFNVPRQELSPDDDFFKKLGVNSLQTLELLTRLENHFGVEMPDYEIQGVTDFRTLADRILARL